MGLTKNVRFHDELRQPGAWHLAILLSAVGRTRLSRQNVLQHILCGNAARTVARGTISDGRPYRDRISL